MPDRPPAAPRITRLEWGAVEIDSGETFKDVKLWPGGARAWDWNETGTAHDPGIQPDDVEELLDHGARVVVLSRGVHARLKVPDETLGRLQDAGVRAEVLRTERAVERYNELREQEPVGALIHSTC